MKIKLVLVENDENLREDLKELLMFYNFFEIVGEFSDVNAANDFLCTSQADAVFINCEVGNPRFSGDGSYLAYNVSQNCPDLIIVMYDSKEQNASQMYRMNCDAFFVLPFEGMEMQRVVNRVRYLYELLLYKKQSMNRSIMIKTRSGYQLIELNRVLFIERVNRRNRLVTTEGKEVILSGYSLDELERILSESNFYRCYQSFLVNLSKVSFIRVDNESKNYALLLEGYAGEILLSRNKYQEVLKLLKNKFAGISL